MDSTSQPYAPYSSKAVAFGAVAFSALIAVILLAGGAGAQDTTAELELELAGPGAAGELVEVVLGSASAAISDVLLDEGGLTVVLDGDRSGPSTFSIRDTELVAAFDRAAVTVSVITRITSESPGVGSGSEALIGTPFGVDLAVAYGLVDLVVDVRAGDADAANVSVGDVDELTIDVSNGGNIDLADVVVTDRETTICEIAQLPAGGMVRCTVDAVAADSEERTLVASASVADDPDSMVSASDTVTINAGPTDDEVLGAVVTQSDDSESGDQSEEDPDEPGDDDAEEDSDVEASTDTADDGLAMTGGGTQLLVALALTVVALGLAVRSESRAILRRVELR